MTFLNDLDGFAWAMALAILVFCGSILFLDLRDWRNGWQTDAIARAPLFGCLFVLCVLGACSSYSSSDNKPRKSVEGSPRIVGEVHGRHAYTVFICAETCAATGGYALALDGRAYIAMGSGISRRRFRFTYLAQPSGNIYTGISLRVVGVADADSGQTLYSPDLRNHPFRIALYIADLALLIFSASLSFFLPARGKAQNYEDEPEADNTPAKMAGPISLHLD